MGTPSDFLRVAGSVNVLIGSRDIWNSMQVLSLGTVKTSPRFRAAIVYSTLKLLQDSKVFKKRMPEDSDSPTSPGTSVRMNWTPCNALRTRHCSVTKGTVRNWLAIWTKRSGKVEVTGNPGPVLKSHLCSLLRETLKFFSKVLWSHLWGLEGGYSHHQGPLRCVIVVSLDMASLAEWFPKTHSSFRSWVYYLDMAGRTLTLS